MKKRAILFAIACLSAALVANAQQKYSVDHKGASLTDGDVVKVTEYTTNGGEMLMKPIFNVVNKSKASITMYMQREVVELADYTRNSICFGQCMDESTDLSVPVSISAGSAEEGYADFYLNDNGGPSVGTSIIKYKFFTTDMQDPSLTVEVHYVYDKPSNIDTSNAAAKCSISTADGIVTVVATQPKVVSIYHYDGRLYKQIQLQTGRNALNDLPRGCYILEGTKFIL